MIFVPLLFFSLFALCVPTDALKCYANVAPAGNPQVLLVDFDVSVERCFFHHYSCSIPGDQTCSSKNITDNALIEIYAASTQYYCDEIKRPVDQGGYLNAFCCETDGCNSPSTNSTYVIVDVAGNIILPSTTTTTESQEPTTSPSASSSASNVKHGFVLHILSVISLLCVMIDLL